MRRFFLFLLLLILLASLPLWGALGNAADYRGNLQVFVHQRTAEAEGQAYTETEIEVKTSLTDYIISTRDGGLRSAYLYFTPYGLRPLELIADTTTTATAEGFTRSYAADGVFPFVLLADGQPLGPYDYEILEQTPQRTRIRLTTTTPEGLRVEKILTIQDDPFYTIELELKLDGPPGLELEMLLGKDYFLLAPEKVLQGRVYYLADGRCYEALPEEYERFEGLGTVTGQAVLFLKDLKGTTAPAVDYLEGRLRLGVKLEPGPGEHRFLLYAGRAKYTLLQHSRLGLLLNLGAWSQLLVAVVKFLDWLYSLTGNYGWVIILFTIAVRVVLFPLMRKQYYSIAKMQRLQPKIQQLQKRYRQDREILQRKMMELYRKEGINPFSGCLPMLIQLPILWLLWRAILYSAEQIHLSPGFLWMADLSVADPYYIIVVLNVIAMIFQTLLSTPMTTGPEGKPKQNWLLILGMPLFMGYLLRDFPAGMWLYWLLTTLFQIGQQWLINLELRKLGPVVLEPEPEPAAEGESGSGNSDEGRD